MAVLYLAFMYKPDKRWHPGIMINAEPEVSLLQNGPSWTKDGFTLTGQAVYHARARLLHKHHYLFDEASGVSPYDLVLGWGKLSEQSVLDKLSFSQFGRWYEFSWHGEQPLPPAEIGAHCGNMHIIPANAQVRASLDSVGVGDIVDIEGKLVKVTKPGGWEWNTGTGADSRGGRGCKIIYVEKLAIETQG